MNYTASQCEQKGLLLTVTAYNTQERIQKGFSSLTKLADCSIRVFRFFTRFYFSAVIVFYCQHLTLYPFILQVFMLPNTQQSVVSQIKILGWLFLVIYDCSYYKPYGSRTPPKCALDTSIYFRAQYKLSKLVGRFCNIGFIFYCVNRNVQKMWLTKV